MSPCRSAPISPRRSAPLLTERRHDVRVAVGRDAEPLCGTERIDDAVLVPGTQQRVGRPPPHDHVAEVTFAGLDSSPYKARAERLTPKGAGALFTVALKGGYDACVKFVDSLELFSHVANLGDTRSLVIHSASTTHRQLTTEQQVAAGASPDVVRISIGIEDADDLMRDLDRALQIAHR